MWLLYDRVHYISDKESLVICIPWGSRTGNLICQELCRNIHCCNVFYYVHSHSTAQHCVTEWVDDSDSQYKNKLHGKAPMTQMRRKIKPIMLCTCGSYKASFETCLVNLGRLEKHSTVLLVNSRKHHGIVWFSVISHKASPLGPFPDWLALSHGSAERFQSCNICSYDNTGCYYTE